MMLRTYVLHVILVHSLLEDGHKMDKMLLNKLCESLARLPGMFILAESLSFMVYLLLI